MRKQLQPRKEREGETSSKAMASMLATASIVVRYLDRRKNERERKRARSKEVVAFVARFYLYCHYDYIPDRRR